MPSAKSYRIPSRSNGTKTEAGNMPEPVKNMQDYNNACIYMQGFTGNTSAGAATDYQIQLGGYARQLDGLCIIFPAANINDADIISLTINNEQVIIKSHWALFTPAVNIFKQRQYYPVRRALSGSDQVVLNINAVNAHAWYATFYTRNTWLGAIVD